MLLWCIILINLRFTSGSNSKRAAGCQNKQKYGPDLLLCSPAMQYKGVMKYLHDLNKIFYGLQYQQQRDVLSLTIIACPCFNADVSYLYRKTTDADLTNQKMTFFVVAVSTNTGKQEVFLFAHLSQVIWCQWKSCRGQINGFVVSNHSF